MLVVLPLCGTRTMGLLLGLWFIFHLLIVYRSFLLSLLSFILRVDSHAPLSRPSLQRGT